MKPARVLSSLMALQAGLPLFDFSVMAGTGKTAYIAAIQAGLVRVPRAGGRPGYPSSSSE